MGLFAWAAPLFGRWADRWSDEDAAVIAGWLSGAVGTHGTVLDIGGGTGALAVRLADILGVRVTVLDPTPEMLAYVPEHHRVAAVVGVAERMPFESGTFDAAIVSDAFHHFRDQGGAVREMARVVRRGGTVVVLDLDPRPFAMRLIVLGERLVGEPGAFRTPEDMCDFMAAHGIHGDCERTKGSSYRFLGTVE